MNPRQRSTPTGVTVRGMFSRGPAPRPSDRTENLGEGPFQRSPGLPVREHLLLTFAPLSCLVAYTIIGGILEKSRETCKKMENQCFCSSLRMT